MLIPNFYQAIYNGSIREEHSNASLPVNENTTSRKAIQLRYRAVCHNYYGAYTAKDTYPDTNPTQSSP